MKRFCQISKKIRQNLFCQKQVKMVLDKKYLYAEVYDSRLCYKIFWWNNHDLYGKPL